MVGRLRDPGTTHVLVVEDNVAAHDGLKRGLAKAHDQPGSPNITARFTFHDEAVMLASARSFQTVLIDALRNDNDRIGRPLLHRFAGLEVAQAFQDAGADARLIGYSARAHDPTINITFREIHSVGALYETSDLADHMTDVLWGDDHEYAVPPPTEADYAELNLLPTARPWEALRVTMAHPAAWEAVVQYGTISKLPVEVRDWFNDHLPALLPLRSERSWRWRAYADILQRIAWIH